MSDPVPIHLICGFLGAGKTTLLRRILAEQPEEERLVVLVNEFGELGIDGRLLSGFESEVLELTSGCICCTLKADFVTSLDQALQTFRPHRVLVEATGLAEAGDLANAVDILASRRDVVLASVATVVDADFFTYREMLGPLYFNQIKQADLLLLNKTDLVPAAQVESLTSALNEINQKARVMPVVHCAVDRATILAPRPEWAVLSSTKSGLAGELQTMLPDLTSPPGHEDHDHDHDSTEGFIAFSFEHDGALDPECLERFLNGLPWGIFRLKGFVRLPQGMSALNYTYRRPEWRPIEDGQQRTALAFVAWRVDPQEIKAGLERCVLEE